jgi:hypothetical protein
MIYIIIFDIYKLVIKYIKLIQPFLQIRQSKLSNDKELFLISKGDIIRVLIV